MVIAKFASTNNPNKQIRQCRWNVFTFQRHCCFTLTKAGRTTGTLLNKYRIGIDYFTKGINSSASRINSQVFSLSTKHEKLDYIQRFVFLSSLLHQYISKLYINELGVKDKVSSMFHPPQFESFTYQLTRTIDAEHLTG